MVTKNQKVIIQWRINTKNHYVGKGYIFTKIGDDFEIDVSDLTKGSHVYVEFICDHCNGDNQIKEKHKKRMYRTLMFNKNKGLKDFCITCAAGSKNNKIDNEKTLSYLNPKIAAEWNYEKNIETPDQLMSKSGKKVWWICEKGHEWDATICNRTMTNSNCPYCGNKKLCKDNSLLYVSPELSKEWHPTKNGDLTPKDVIYATKKKYWWLCSDGHAFKISPTLRISRGTGCSICNESKGEKSIRELLESLQLKFSPQFAFNDLFGVGGKHLKFDFAIHDDDNNIITLVEYDGIFHYEKRYENDGYERTIKHDKLKNEYCETNDVPLLRIPYWDFDNIEEILLKELKKYHLI